MHRNEVHYINSNHLLTMITIILVPCRAYDQAYWLTLSSDGSSVQPCILLEQAKWLGNCDTPLLLGVLHLPGFFTKARLGHEC